MKYLPMCLVAVLGIALIALAIWRTENPACLWALILLVPCLYATRPEEEYETESTSDLH